MLVQNIFDMYVIPIMYRNDCYCRSGNIFGFSSKSISTYNVCHFLCHITQECNNENLCQEINYYYDDGYYLGVIPVITY